MSDPNPYQVSHCDQFGKMSYAAEEGEDGEEDEFEKEMTLDMANRMDKAERESGISLEREEADSNGTPTSVPKASTSSTTNYDPIYFDSDDDDDDDTTVRNDKRKMQTNDELLYDPDMDEQDQIWVDNMREAYSNPGKERLKKQKESGIKPLPSSDAVLNCPGCFTLLTLDCQRHEVYENQYRAMFVMNCKVQSSEKLKFPVGKTQSKKKNKGPIKSDHQSGDEDFFSPVKCEECDSEVGVYDKDEVYHFFNIIASYT